MTVRIIDMHSHWGTRKGYALQTPDELAQQHATFNSDSRYMSEDEMAAHFRERGISSWFKADRGALRHRPEGLLR
jgi:hypothetical protein